MKSYIEDQWPVSAPAEGWSPRRWSIWVSGAPPCGPRSSGADSAGWRALPVIPDIIGLPAVRADAPTAARPLAVVGALAAAGADRRTELTTRVAATSPAVATTASL